MNKNNESVIYQRLRIKQTSNFVANSSDKLNKIFIFSDNY